MTLRKEAFIQRKKIMCKPHPRSKKEKIDYSTAAYTQTSIKLISNRKRLKRKINNSLIGK